MKKVVWVIQTNLLQDFAVQGVWESAQKLGCETHEALVTFFKDDIDNEEALMRISVEGAVIIPYGSYKLSRLAKVRGWRGDCHVDETFRTDVWLKKRNDMLNAQAIHMKVKQVQDYLRNEPEDKKFFIRPVEDLKSFAGTVTDVHDIREWMNSTTIENYSFNKETEVMLAPVKTIYSESRFFIVDGKVIDGSYYQFGGRVHVAAIKQQEMYERVQQMADQWLPHPCCVMDVAETDEGYKVIEFNTINSAGFYAHDIPKFVEAMTRWAEKQ